MVNEDIYVALETVADVDAVFDTKRPDNYDLTGSVLVFSCVSDVPSVPIDGAILGNEQRWQISVYAKSLTAARATKAGVITALHAYEGGTILRADFESAPGELYDSETLEYHLPLDFLIQI